MEYLPQQNRNRIVLQDDVRTKSQYPLGVTVFRTGNEQFWNLGSTVSISVMILNNYDPVLGKGFSFVPLGMESEDAVDEDPSLLKDFVVNIHSLVGSIADFQSTHPFSILRRDPSLIRLQGVSLARREDTTLTIAVSVETVKPFFDPPRPLIEITGLTKDQWLHCLYTEGDP